MKIVLKIFSVIITAVILCSCGKVSDKISEEIPDMTLGEQTLEQLDIQSVTEAPDKQYTPVNFDIQKAMWLTMMDYESLLKDRTKQEFTDNIKKAYEDMISVGINTVYVHVRPFNDVYYDSDMFPRAEYYSEDADYDPLEIMLQEGHSAGLSVHAWINPLRCQIDSEMQNTDDKYTIKKWYSDKDKNGTYISQVGDRWYLNPAYDDVIAYICDGISDITENYDVDGIHIDDYFYPTKEDSFDAAAFSESGSDDIEQWRTDNINKMVKSMYKTVRESGSDILFGISPQGNTESNYSTQYADVKKWSAEEGYCDYIVPQIYFGFENESQPFKETVDEWISLNKCDSVNLVIGICTYKIGTEDKWAGSGINEWKENEGIPAKQAEYVLEKNLGTAVYSYGSTFDENIKDECEQLGRVLEQ